MSTYIDDSITLQEFPNKMTEMLGKVGWSPLARYRAYKKGTRQFAEVRIFESIGSDKLRRNLGMAWGYDLDKPTFEDSRFISETSRLALLGVGDGTKKTFKILAGPMTAGTERVSFDGVDVAKNTYTWNEQFDEITFATAPAAGTIVKATGFLSSKAHEPANTFSFFTYNDVYFDQVVLKGTPNALLGVANGTKTVFTILKNPIRPGTVKVYVNSILVNEDAYLVDYEAGTVTFTTAPASGNVEADYRYFMTPIRGVDYGDIEVVSSETDALLPKSYMTLAYGAFTFIQASIPTVMSLTDDPNFSRTFSRDTFLYAWGSINKDRLAMFFRANPSSDPQKSFFAPFYFGRIHVVGHQPQRNTVLIGGSKNGGFIPWDDKLVIGGTPLNYGTKTSNGNQSVMLHQSLGGALYQEHYLAFHTHHVGLDTPDTKFNPSAYTGKYHISQLSIVHPYDGVVGVLDDVFAVHPKNIEQRDELELDKIVPKEWIGDGDGVRKVFHLTHQPNETEPLIFGNCVEITTGFVYDEETKSITFTIPPAIGIELTASYTAKHLYQYALPTTPQTPMRLDNMTPFNPTGWGIHKKPIE